MVLIKKLNTLIGSFWDSSEKHVTMFKLAISYYRQNYRDDRFKRLANSRKANNPKKLAN